MSNIPITQSSTKKWAWLTAIVVGALQGLKVVKPEWSTVIDILVTVAASVGGLGVVTGLRNAAPTPPRS